MIRAVIAELGPWIWWVAGLLLLGLEILAPGSFFMWFGIAAIMVGAIALMVDIAWQYELLAFVVLALVLLLVGRRRFARHFGEERPSGLNERGERLVGTRTALVDAIVDGFGRIRIDDTLWRVSGPDLPAGTMVRVTATDGAVLKVEAD